MRSVERPHPSLDHPGNSCAIAWRQLAISDRAYDRRMGRDGILRPGCPRRRVGRERARIGGPRIWIDAVGRATPPEVTRRIEGAVSSVG